MPTTTAAEKTGYRGLIRYALCGAVFVITGVMQTVCTQALFYQGGGGEHNTFLISLPNYLGNLMVFALGEPVLSFIRRAAGDSKDGSSKSARGKRVSLKILFHPERRKLFVLALNELIGFALGLTGLALAGSGLYQIVQSGTTVFNALLTTVFLGRKLPFIRWLFLAMITFGLVITAEHLEVPLDAYASVINGVICTLVSCLFYSLNFVFVEYLLSKPSSENQQLGPPTGPELSLFTHGTCLIVFALYTCVHTIPHWSSMVAHSIESHHGAKGMIIGLYFCICCASFLHAVTYYDLISTLGAVPVGIMGAIRAVSVFAVSALFFCERQASQCYTSRKGLVTIIVTFGAIGYSLTKTKTKAEETE